MYSYMYIDGMLQLNHKITFIIISVFCIPTIRNFYSELVISASTNRAKLSTTAWTLIHIFTVTTTHSYSFLFPFRYSVSVFLVPLIVLIVTYTAICREIWHSSVGQLEFKPHHVPKINRGKRTPLISRAKINTVKQTIAVIVMYIVCSTPFICAQLWATWNPGTSFIEGEFADSLQKQHSII